MHEHTVCAIIVAAGSSKRMGFDKLAHIIDGQSVLEKSVLAFDKHDMIDSLVIVIGEAQAQQAAQIEAQCAKPCKIVQGGDTRAQSVAKGLEYAFAEYVAIHDAARPFVSADIITRTIKAAMEYKAAAPCVPIKDTIKRTDKDGFVLDTPPRSEMYAVETPQVFDKALYLAALCGQDDITDDCQVIERAHGKVKLVEGEYTNYKITTIDDIKEHKAMRIGHGYDVHKLVQGRKLILGGVTIDYSLGLDGHSDADVLTHAVMDALLGAAALGDIGLHFPDNQDSYKGADSIELLKIVMDKVKASGYAVCNIDATILCQEPKLRGNIDIMRENIARAINADISMVSIKATTEEGLGFTGAKLGIAAHAVALLKTR